MAQGWEETDKNDRPIIYNEVAAGAQKQQLRKGALAYIQGFPRKQAQITTGAIEALHSKPEVKTKAKRSLKAITQLNRTNEDPKSRKKGKDTGLTREKGLL